MAEPQQTEAAAPNLLDVLDKHQAAECSWGIDGCVCEWAGSRENHPRHVADAWREACTIRTAEQLDTLPVGSAIVDCFGDVYRSHDRPGVQSPAWLVSGALLRWLSDEIPMPVHVIWRPDWAVQ